MSLFKDMCKLLEEKQIGVAKLEKYTVEQGNFMAAISGVSAGNYVRLYVNGQLMMSNTSMEKRTAMEFINNAEGDILIAGLGIGLVILPLLENKKVTSVTIVEKYQDVIDCILPQIKPYDIENKLMVICEDCFDFITEQKFDVIYLDIWAYINSDVYNEEMKPLKRKYRKSLKPEKKTVQNIYVWAEWEAKNNARLV